MSDSSTVPAKEPGHRVLDPKGGRPVLPSTGVHTPLGLAEVALDGGFWGKRQQLNRKAIQPHALAWVERLGWTKNFDDAASGLRYEHQGREFADSEVYKLVEALSWEVAREPDDNIEAIIVAMVERLASAQEPDGYLHTLYGRAWQEPRYSNFEWGHELYCYGHLIQAAVARARTHGEDTLLDVARKVADHVCTMFGADGLNRVCGHPVIEVALAELGRVTGEQRYLNQAAIFVERRGTGTLAQIEFGRGYYQDDVSVRDTTVLHGHAVRALYLAAGAVDVAVENGDKELFESLIRQWDSTVARRTYITGGMGSHHMDEAFGEDFVLPSDRSYCETCAGVASIMFSWRLLLATDGVDTRYGDLIERTLYNIIATSPSEHGTAFFYGNTLHQRSPGAPPAINDEGVCIRGGASLRQSWFEVSCCPPNVSRTLASLAAYVATTSPKTLRIHQFASGRIDTEVPGVGRVCLEITTQYPLAGEIEIRVLEAPQSPWTLAVRVPSWAQGATVGVDDGEAKAVTAGRYAEVAMADAGVARLTLPLAPEFVSAAAQVDAVRGCVAVQRGPEVYCLESVDLPWPIDVGEVTVDTSIPPRHEAGRVYVTLRRTDAPPSDTLAAVAVGTTRNGKIGTDLESSVPTAEVELIPYHTWANRGPASMRVWIPAV